MAVLGDRIVTAAEAADEAEVERLAFHPAQLPGGSFGKLGAAR